MSGTLYVVGTPIGNLDDMPGRAARILCSADVCYAEDTRRTGTLLARLEADVPLRSLHRHNERSRVDEILAHLARGNSIALVSDAGTPTVSDPGRLVLGAVREAGYDVCPIPGPSAILAALSISGLPADRFSFFGFAPRRGSARAAWIAELLGCPHTTIVFEAPGRVGALLEELARAGLADRHAVLCREMTKLHEEIMAGSVDELAAEWGPREVRGEVTLVFAGAPPGNEGPDLAVLMDKARHLSREGLRRREIADQLAEECGLSRNEAYRVSLRVGETPSDD
ncbi:16S rRNA (cytidine(1402)-2'-O)-methyltransferase [Candidatus Palauibacter sp.]|uniref:16S rRNA (cytidine(1402)-2'-O)-methyltransferase n=1 Tax=Candidatus Palauibacter sp. TaxID=3101350 RepID=UPI003B02BF3D